jgi:hypothetical protein
MLFRRSPMPPRGKKRRFAPVIHPMLKLMRQIRGIGIDPDQITTEKLNWIEAPGTA